MKKLLIIILLIAFSLSSKDKRSHRVSDWDDISELEHLETVREQKANIKKRAIKEDVTEQVIVNGVQTVVLFFMIFGGIWTLLYAFNTLKGTDNLVSENRKLKEEIRKAQLGYTNRTQFINCERDVTPKQKYLA